MKSSLLIGLLALLIIGCKEKAVEYFNRNYIHTFYHPDSSERFLFHGLIKYLPAPDDSKGLFILVDSNRVAYTQKGLLNAVYKKYFSTINYYNFIYDALNQKVVYPSNLILGYKFHLTTSIINTCKQKGVEEILKTYFEKTESEYQLKSPVESEQQLTILYFMFLNGYEIAFDDYEGVYYIKYYKQVKDTN